MTKQSQSPTLTDVFVASKSALVHYIARFFVVPEDIEDTVYEAYLKVLSVEKESPLDCPRAYLFRVARNIALNKKARQKKVFERNLGAVEESHLIDDAWAPHTAAVSEENIRSICAAIDALPAQCRKVFLLQRMEGLSYKEIAHCLGISTRTVEKHLEKALNRCAHYLVENRYVDEETDNVEQIEKYRRRGR